MGIRPKADGENIVLTDTHRDLVDDVTATTDEFGTVLGEGINEIAATAKSANDSAGELAARVKVLEERAAVPVSVVAEASMDVADRQRRYVTFNMTAPQGWETTAVSITPPAGWCRIRLWTTLNAPVSIAGVGVSGDMSLAHVGLTSPAVDMVAQVSSAISVRYRADGPATFRLEVTPITTTP